MKLRLLRHLLYSAFVPVFLFQFTELQVILKEMHTILDLLFTRLSGYKTIIWTELSHVFAISRQTHVSKQCPKAYISRVWPRP